VVRVQQASGFVRGSSIAERGTPVAIGPSHLEHLSGVASRRLKIKCQIRARTTPSGWPGWLAARPGASGQTLYECNGVANLSMVFAPLEGWRHVKVTDCHTAIDYAQMEVTTLRHPTIMGSSRRRSNVELAWG
jgi:hypothetical protein